MNTAYKIKEPAYAGPPPARGEFGSLIALPELSTKANSYTIKLIILRFIRLTIILLDSII